MNEEESLQNTMLANDGRKVASVFWDREGEFIDAKAKGSNWRMVYRVEWLEQYSYQGWVVVYINGREMARHNTKYIATIEWEDDTK